MLNMVLNECLEKVRGLRPESEIANLINLKMDEIKTYDPNNDWESLEYLGKGGFG